MNLTGKNYIAGELSAASQKVFQTFDPKAAEVLDQDFYEATIEEIDLAVVEAHKAFEIYRNIPAVRRADFLRTIAHEIKAVEGPMLSRYVAESGLPMGRAQGEMGRTIFQLNSFADHIEKGDYVRASIDHGDPNRSPAPKPDLRKMMIPIGPIAVFGASNFPLAYSTAGGDTASALAAGCPVVVKSHPMHAGTGEYIAAAISRAVASCGMPKGVFSNLNSSGIEVGQSLVSHPQIKGVGFTGSIKGGRALYNLASKREEPIPVFAEMGSINPVVVLPQSIAEKEDRASWAKQYAGSISLAAGQFCTNPGLIFGLKDSEFVNFGVDLTHEIQKVEAQVMLHPGIKDNFDRNFKKIAEQEGVETLVNSDSFEDLTRVGPYLMQVSGAEFLKNLALHQEVFGPSSLLVVCDSVEELNEIIDGLEGQLTASIIAGELELINYAPTVEKLQNRVGRLIFNGVPTGVEVAPSMVHGGPYPASSDSRFTAVGLNAVDRWLRPFSYQDWPGELLPDALQEDNPLEILRQVDGNWQR